MENSIIKNGISVQKCLGFAQNSLNTFRLLPSIFTHNRGGGDCLSLNALH
jgi:hypothetical protein